MTWKVSAAPLMIPPANILYDVTQISHGTTSYGDAGALLGSLLKLVGLFGLCMTFIVHFHSGEYDVNLDS